MTAERERLRVLHAGPLDSIHLARWVELTAELGHVPVVAGHLRRGFRAAELAASVDRAHRAWQLPWASRRGTQLTGRALHRALASLPNGLVEVPLWAAWLRRLMRGLDVDVVHAHWLPSWGAASGLARARPLVAGAMGSDVYLLEGVERRFADVALARARVVVAPSPHAAAALRARGVPANRCVHLEPGIDLDAFRPPSDAERGSARDALGVGGGPVVLSFRSAGPVYGLPLAIEAFRRLRTRRADAQLIVVHGPIPRDGATEAAIRSLGGGVRVLGDVPHAHMRTCFHAADVGISVPSSDGSPVSLWECLSCGTP